MSEAIVAFDESGNSGGNLLDGSQPVFVLASVHLSGDSVKAILNGNPRELKFARLNRNVRGRRQIIEVLNSPLLTTETFLISGFHKPFMAITKLVDLLVEPLFYARGIDLYERGGNLAMANLFHFTMPVYIGKKRFERLRSAFVQMVRNPSNMAIDRFYKILRTAYERLEHEEFEADLAMLLATRPVAEAYRKDFDTSDLDPAIPSFVEHASEWTARLGTTFRIIHDVSKPLLQEQIVLEAMMSTDESPKEIGYDRRKMAFPFRASGIEFQDSAVFPAIQIADIIASSTAYCLRSSFHKRSDRFVDELLSTAVLAGTFRPLWPQLKVTPHDLSTDVIGGIDANSYVGNYVSKRLGGIPPKGQRRKP
jgi:hypothetical protein